MDEASKKGYLPFHFDPKDSDPADEFADMIDKLIREASPGYDLTEI